MVANGAANHAHRLLRSAADAARFLTLFEGVAVAGVASSAAVVETAARLVLGAVVRGAACWVARASVGAVRGTRVLARGVFIQNLQRIRADRAL